MSFDHKVAAITAAIAFASLLFLLVQILVQIRANTQQLRDSAQQRESESIVNLYDINRQLLSLAFDHPKLFPILDDGKDADPVWEKHYLQLWFNQFSLLHFYLQRSAIGEEFRESLVRDVGDFMIQHNMQKHWRKYRRAYSASFQTLVDGIIKKNEPPKAAHAENESASQAAKT